MTAGSHGGGRIVRPPRPYRYSDAGSRLAISLAVSSPRLPRAPRPSSREADGLQLASSWTRDGRSLTEAARAGISLGAPYVLAPREAHSIAFLVIDNWDDWFKYNTLYGLVLVDDQGNRHDIGGVKIGQFNMKDGQRRPAIPQAFEQLDEQFFSLGRDDSYYEKLNLLGQQIANEVLTALRDIAANPALFDQALVEDVTGVSLLRSVSPATVRGQFRRLAAGGARLSRYAFDYQLPPATKNAAEISLSFEVVPDAEPPTNIHVLIGRNGVGKTTLLYRMTRAFQIFGLAELYAAHAAEELLNIRGYLGQLLDNGGAGPVKAHLQLQAASSEAARTNSWQTATYKAFAASDWFCAGGFRPTG